MNRYPWPSSAVSSAEMAILHRVRESSQTRVPITKLIAQAIRNQYGHDLANQPEPEPQPERQTA